VIVQLMRYTAPAGHKPHRAVNDVTFAAAGFTCIMARSLTAGMVNVGLGNLTSAQLAGLIKSRSQILAVVTAAPQGLLLGW
jgi:tRNA U38,U39,U40 pseudouridine synthase TruA